MQKKPRGGLIKLPIFPLDPCCCRLLVQMEEDGGVLEFNASAGDLLRAKSDKKVGKSKAVIIEAFRYWSQGWTGF